MSKKPRDGLAILKAELIGAIDTGNRFIDLVQQYGLLMGNENAPDDVVQAQNRRRDEIINEINALSLTHPAELEVRLHVLALHVGRNLPDGLLISQQIKAGLDATSDALKGMHDIRPVSEGDAS